MDECQSCSRATSSPSLLYESLFIHLLTQTHTHILIYVHSIHTLSLSHTPTLPPPLFHLNESAAGCPFCVAPCQPLSAHYHCVTLHVQREEAFNPLPSLLTLSSYVEYGPPAHSTHSFTLGGEAEFMCVCFSVCALRSV